MSQRSLQCDRAALHIGVGVNSGTMAVVEMAVVEMGVTASRFDTATGEAVNFESLRQGAPGRMASESWSAWPLSATTSGRRLGWRHDI
jgi:hypothetical protein